MQILHFLPFTAPQLYANQRHKRYETFTYVSYKSCRNKKWAQGPSRIYAHYTNEFNELETLPVKTFIS